MSGPFGSSQWMYASGFYNNVVNQSLRFEDGDSAKLAITPGSASNRRTFTFSSWVKRSTITADGALFACGANAQNRTQIYFLSNDKLGVYSNASNSDVIYAYTDAVFRDVSAWYNVVVAIDTTDGTAGNRLKMYVNGVLQSYTYDTTPSQNDDLNINNNVAHAIGSDAYAAQNLFDGYLADVNFIDGTALTAASFGETKSGIWIPKDTSGLTFGTNGFRLEFKQTGTGTASTSTIGADTSGQTNHLTSTNLAATDSNMPDCPENNFNTANRLHKRLDGTVAISEGNLKISAGSDYGGDNRFAGTTAVSSGKWYFEMLRTDATGLGNQTATGVFDADTDLSSGAYGGNGTNAGAAANEWALTDRGYACNTSTYTNLSGTIGTVTQNKVVQVAVDMDNKKIWFGIDNTFSGDPAAGSGEAFSNLPTTILPLLYTAQSTQVFNFGQDSSFAGNETAQGNADGNGVGDFYYSPPSGYLALCSANLPDPAIDPAKDETPADHFNTVLWTGNGSDGRSITGVGFDSDFVWIKSRNLTTSHLLNDTIRGANKSLFSEGTNAETADNGGGYLSAFVTDGFSVTSGGSGDDAVNDSSDTYVAWCWEAGGAPTADNSAGAGATPTAGSVKIDGSNLGSALAGSIAATRLSANTSQGFSIGTFTKGSGTETVAHGLGAAPDWLIVKRTNGTGSWAVYHSGNTANPETDYLRLNSTNGTADDATFWGDTAPTSTVFSIGAAFNSGEELVFYAWTDISGYSKFGTYEGNGNADGPFLHLGFRPAWIMIKNLASGENWEIWDNTRDPDNVVTLRLIANTTGADVSSTFMDFVSNGIKFRNYSGGYNSDGGTFIYLAFAEQVFKYANAR